MPSAYPLLFPLDIFTSNISEFFRRLHGVPNPLFRMRISSSICDHLGLDSRSILLHEPLYDMQRVTRKLEFWNQRLTLLGGPEHMQSLPPQINTMEDMANKVDTFERAEHSGLFRVPYDSIAQAAAGDDPSPTNSTPFNDERSDSFLRQIRLNTLANAARSELIDMHLPDMAAAMAQSGPTRDEEHTADQEGMAGKDFACDSDGSGSSDELAEQTLELFERGCNYALAVVAAVLMRPTDVDSLLLKWARAQQLMLAAHEKRRKANLDIERCVYHGRLWAIARVEVSSIVQEIAAVVHTFEFLSRIFYRVAGSMRQHLTLMPTKHGERYGLYSNPTSMSVLDDWQSEIFLETARIPVVAYMVATEFDALNALVVAAAALLQPQDSHWLMKAWDRVQELVKAAQAKQTEARLSVYRRVCYGHLWTSAKASMAAAAERVEGAIDAIEFLSLVLCNVRKMVEEYHSSISASDEQDSSNDSATDDDMLTSEPEDGSR